MKFKLPFYIAILFFIASCQSKSAFEFSNTIVKMEKELVPDIEKTESDVQRYISVANYDSIAIAGQRMESLVDAKLTELKNLPAPKAKDADNFKIASIHYFEYLKSIYTSYKNFGMQKTDETREIEKDKLLDLVNKKQAAIDDMQNAQRRFADANGFKIKND